jgi:cupin fold WbuC family metalloprotein
MAGVQLVNQALLDTLIERASQAPRLRTNHNFHASLDENLHRFLNVMMRGTYIRPHRHLSPPKAEAFLVLQGEVACFIFDDSGRIVEKHVLGKDPKGIDVAAGLWHSLAVLSPHAVCYEVKPGPYQVTTDKGFAPWAPEEGAPGAAGYVAWLESQARG